MDKTNVLHNQRNFYLLFSEKKKPRNKNKYDERLDGLFLYLFTPTVMRASECIST